MTHAEPTTGEQCLLCLVRQMTEGVPESVDLTEPGDSVTGVVLRRGTVPHPFFLPPPDDTVPFIDLWVASALYTVRRRFIAYGFPAQRAITDTDPQIGDTWTIHYEGRRPVPNRRTGETREIKIFRADVKRGHH